MAEDPSGNLTAPIGAGIVTAPIAAPDPVKETPDLARLKKMFDDSREATQEARTQATIDRDYYDGHQLTDYQRQVLRARKQPDVVFNRVRGGVNGILGVILQGKTDPRAFMRNPPDKPQQQPGQPPAQQPDADAGDIATMVLRFIADTNDFTSIRRSVAENILIEGVGAAIFEVDQANENNVTASPIRAEEFFYDPRSRRADFLDARYMGVGKWMYADILAAMYPEQAKLISDFSGSGKDASGVGSSAYDGSWEDRPENVSPWIDSKQHRLMVVEMYYIQDAEWHRCVFYAGSVLESSPSPYKDDKDQAICPIIAQSAYVDRENRRYGVVRDMRGPQDEINMRRSKALHEINSRQIQQVDPNAPPIDAETARKEASRPDGILPPGYNAILRQDVIANNITLLQEAKGEIERFGPSPAILGRQGADASGRAQQIRQQAGITELLPVLSNIENWEERCHKMAYGIARQYWNDPKIIRVTDELDAPRYIRINEIVGQQPVIDPQTGQQVMQPVYENHIAKMDVDIVVDTVRDTATLQQEVFDGIIQLVPIYGPQEFPLSLVLEMSPLPKRAELIKKLQELKAEQAQAMMQNPAAQIEMAEAKAGIAKTMSDVDKNRATTKKTDIEATISAMNATAQGRALTRNEPPPGHSGALNGSGLPQQSQGPPPG
jgi:hypothetical protein